MVVLKKETGLHSSLADAPSVRHRRFSLLACFSAIFQLCWTKGSIADPYFDAIQAVIYLHKAAVRVEIP